MGLALAILGFLGTVVPLLWAWWTGRSKEASRPEVRKEAYAQAVRREVATDDERAANERLDAGLRALRGRVSRPGGPEAEGGKGV